MKKSAPKKIELKLTEVNQQPADSTLQSATVNNQAAGSPDERRAAAAVDSPTLKDFVYQAWTHLEPVSPLVWNWHLDLICDYLTLIKDNRFKEKCGVELEGIIFNVPPRTMKSLLISVFFPIWLWT